MSGQPVQDVQTQPGDRIGSYQIVEQLGAGGSAVVWKAHDALLDRYIAIKQFRTPRDQITEVFRQAVVREVELQRRLTPPPASASEGSKSSVVAESGVVRIYDLIDRTEEPPTGLFLLMEYVPGLSLEQQLLAQDGPIDPVTGVRLVYSVAKVLKQIHDAGVLHRDLKPSNVLLPTVEVDEGDDGTTANRSTIPVKICDLGLAALMSDQGALSVGSVRYMSPELLRGEPGDERSDLYSLGMLAYELLLGRAKFDEVFKGVVKDPRQAGMRWMKWHTNVKARPQSLHELNPQVARPLSELVDRMIEKDPARRVANTQQLIDAIERRFTQRDAAVNENTTEPDSSTTTNTNTTASTSTTASSTASTGGDTVALPNRKRTVQIAAALILAIGLIGSGIIISGQWLEAQEAQQIMQARAEQMDEGRTLADAGQYAEAEAVYTDLAAQFDEGDPNKQQVQGAVLWMQTHQSMETGDYDAALATLQKLENDPAFGLTNQRIYQLKRDAEQRAAYRNIMLNVEQLIDDNQLRQATMQLDELDQTGQITPAEMEAIESLQVRIRDQRRQLALSRSMVQVDDLIVQQRYEEAVAALDRMAFEFGGLPLEQKRREIEQKRQIQLLTQQLPQAQLANDRTEIIRIQESLATLTGETQWLDEVNVLKSQIALEEGDRLMQDGNRIAANIAYERALSLNPQNSDAAQRVEQLNLDDRIDALLEAAEAAAILRQWDEAMTHYDRGLELMSATAPQRSRFEEGRLKVARESILEQAEAARKQGDLATALSLYQQAGDIESERSITQEIRYLSAMNTGDELLAASRFVEAKSAYREARDLRETEEIQERLDTAEVAHMTAQARRFIELREYQAARATLQSALRIRDTEEVKALLKQVMTLEAALAE